MLKYVVGLALLLHLFSPGQVMQASASIQAIATNPATQRVESGTLKMSAFPDSSGLQPGNALSINKGGNIAYFVVKNIGTLALSSFSLTQTSGETIYHCRGFAFQSSKGKLENCADGNPADAVGSANTISNILLASTLTAGQSQQFAITTIRSNSISISVDHANR